MLPFVPGFHPLLIDLLYLPPPQPPGRPEMMEKNEINLWMKLLKWSLQDLTGLLEIKALMCI